MNSEQAFRNSAKREFVRVFYEPRGHRECGGVFVELECAHVIVVPPRGTLDKLHHCWHCAEGARVDALLRVYLPPIPGAPMPSSARSINA